MMCTMARKPLTLKQIAILIAVAVGMCALTVIVIWCAIQFSNPFNARAFSAAEWRTGDINARGSMARSAVRDHLRPGLAAADVVALLGKPGQVLTGAKDIGGNRLSGVKTYSYSIGNWSLGGMDDAFLYVHLDSADRVIEAEIRGY